MEFPFPQIKFRKVKRLRKDLEKIKEVGDYFKNWIIVKDTGINWYNELIWLHELIEYYLVTKMEIDWKEIDKFDTDKEFREKNREKYENYRKAHQLAEEIEEKIAKFLKLDWQGYSNFIKNYGTN